MRPAQRGAVLLGAVLLGAAAGVALIPVAFRRIPNDLSRIATVLRISHAGAEVVVLGDSRAEAAVDARQLSAELPGRPPAFNLAWHAQRFPHSFALIQELSPSVRVVAILVSLQDLSDAKPGDSRVWSAMRGYGYDPTPATLATMTAAFGADVPAALTMSRVKASLDARWGIRQLADTSLRSVVRRDLRLAREREDPYFPTAYTGRLSSANFDAIAAVVPVRVGPRAMSRPKETLLAGLGSSARSRNLRIVLVIPATHPRLMVASHEQRVAQLRGFASQHGLEVIDGSGWLTDEDFVDPLHASASGARKFTSALAAALRGRG